MTKFRLLFTFFILFFFSNCATLPKEKLNQFSLEKFEYEVDNDSLRIEFANPLHCPLRISANSNVESMQKKLAQNFPVTLAPKTDTVLTYPTNKSKEELSLGFSATLSTITDEIQKEKINLPFKKSNRYKIIQGYNGGYSHSTEYSKYALDFNLKIGDTVCAVADGYVVGVIEGYEKSGKTKKWRDYANYITIFHPKMNLYTQYVHLMLDGSFVEVGDAVESGQIIGLSGKTGYTDVEHLHFNILRVKDSEMQSVQIEFKEGYKGANLKKGDWVEK